MGFVDFQAIHQANGIRGHIGEVVRRVDFLTGHHLLQDRAEVDRRCSLELGRQPDISIVEANHAEATGGEAVAERLRPRYHLRGETHDQQDGRIVPATSVVVRDLYSIG
jgi:hypothetical protein